MPKKDLWVGIAEPDPTSTADSTGSCESVISNNSSSLEMTDSGYDYLSVEEKECLMFLEETLHSLDTEEGSGLSTDEAEAAEPSKHPRTWPTRDVPKELDHDHLGKNKTFDSMGKKSLFGSIPVVILSPSHYSLPKNITNSVQASKVFAAESTGTNADDGKTLPQTQAMSRGPSKRDTLDIPVELPEINTQERISDLELVVIPPPEPFQDKSQSHLRIGLEPIRTDTRRVIESRPTSHFEVTRNQDIREEYEARAVQQEASLGKMEIAPGNESLLKPLSSKCNKNSSDQRIDSQETDHRSILEEAQLEPSFRQGPPTAPKPRKLPPNIILKTSKSNVVSPSVDPKHKIKVLLASNGRPRAATGDFSVEKAQALQKEQGRARREALEKLGLPLENEKNSDEHVIQTSLYSKPRETSRTGSREKSNMDDVTSSKQSVQQSDQTGGKEVQPIELTIPNVKQANFKSYTLERSGVGLSSCISSGGEGQNLKNNKTSFLNKITPGFLRNSRLRPASCGMAKDFLDQEEDKLHNVELEKNYERRSYPLQPPSKLPRPPCVSVKITPKGTTEEHRREALKKLGLLKE